VFCDFISKDRDVKQTKKNVEGKDFDRRGENLSRHLKKPTLRSGWGGEEARGPPKSVPLLSAHPPAQGHGHPPQAGCEINTRLKMCFALYPLTGLELTNSFCTASHVAERHFKGRCCVPHPYNHLSLSLSLSHSHGGGVPHNDHARAARGTVRVGSATPASAGHPEMPLCPSAARRGHSDRPAPIPAPAVVGHHP